MGGWEGGTSSACTWENYHSVGIVHSEVCGSNRIVMAVVLKFAVCVCVCGRIYTDP